MGTDTIQNQINACRKLGGKPDNKGKEFVCHDVDKEKWRKLYPFEEDAD